MITGDNIPGNEDANAFDLNTGGWILIAILITVIIVLFIITVELHVKSEKKIQELKEFNKAELSDKERDLLLKYRELNDTDKTVVNDTLKTLNKNHKNDTTE